MPGQKKRKDRGSGVHNRGTDVKVGERRSLVARLEARGLERGAMLAALQAEYPEATRVVMRDDLNAIRKEFRERYVEIVGETRMRQAARCEELFRMAFADGDVRGCVAVMEREAKLLGLDAPAKASVDVKVEKADGELAAFMKTLAARRAGAVEGEVLDVE